MTAPNYAPIRTTLLPRDNFRSIIAALIALLTIGGWINVLLKTPLRDHLAAQTRLWWIEQVVSFVLAILCVGIIMRRRSFLTPTFWLTVYSLIFDIIHWIFNFIDGQVEIRVAPLLYALFLWRLWITRKQVNALEATVETTG